MVTTTPDPQPAAPETKPRRSKGAQALTAFGLALILGGIGAVGYVGWEFIGTNVIAKREHTKNIDIITESWTQGEDPANIEGTGLVRIERFGKDWEMPVLDGFDLPTLKEGVGRYPKGAEPGEVGNLVLAGHRRSRGESFREFLELKEGDRVVVETRSHLHTYELIDAGTDFKVDFRTSWPLWPVPDASLEGAEPTERMITLLTCSELFSSDWRSVARGVLVSTQAKTSTGRIANN